MNLESIGSWVKGHPLETGGVVFIGGLAVLWLFGGLGSGGQQAAGPSSSDYYSAVAAQAVSSNQLAETQIAATTETNLAQLAAQTSQVNTTTWANADLAQTESNNQAATSSAPYAFEASVVSTLGQIASLPPTTTVSKSSGFLGIGGGTKVTSTANPNAIAASQSLSDFLNGLYAGH